jgi:ferrous iron transport protein B
MVALRTPVLALVGNPNTGKTTLFNALAGMNQRVGNYPGVTVETKKGKLLFHGQLFEIIDLPGTYSLAARSPDEMVAVDLILGHKEEARPDAVITIVDASNLERNLYLTTQVLELGVPVIIALNMVDVAQRQGLTIDVPKLSARLGVPVVPIQANRGKGLEQLKETVAQTLANPQPVQGPTFPEPFEKEVEKLSERLGPDAPPFLVRRLLLDVGGYTETLLLERHDTALLAELQAARQRLKEAGCPVPAIEARTRYGWIRQAISGCVGRPAQRMVTWTDWIDRVLTHKVIGTFLFLLLMFLVFQSLYFWAKPLMTLISAGMDWLGGLVEDSLEPGPLRSLLTQGIIKGVGGVLVFLPQIIILFAFIAVLEDCGYMARAAFLMDRLMARAGLNGKSFIPLLSSVACAVPGIMAARVIENRRDRLATILVAPLMSCSARLPVYFLLIGAFLGEARGFPFWVPGLTLFGLYCLGLVLAPLVAFLLKRTLLRGETPVFVMEMPLYKMPAPTLVIRRAFEAGWMFIRRAGTLILATMIVVWALLYFPAESPVPGKTYDVLIAEKQESIQEEVARKEELEKSPEANREQIAALDQVIEPVETEIRALAEMHMSQSILGRVGKFLEPAVKPLGWDWRIGMAALASFPAREVMVGTMGIIFGQGEIDVEEVREAGLDGTTGLGTRLQEDEVFNVPTALSVLVFFALCCQCASTLAIIKRESNSWRWPIFTFVYMTVLAYVGALVVYQVGRLFV